MTEPKSPPTRWQAARRAFRWMRIACLLLVLAAVGSFIYLNQVGLPAFVKRRLQTESRARGLDVEFERVRLRWYRGIVAEKLSLAGLERFRGARLTVAEAEIRLDAAALRRFEVKVPSISVRDGRLAWPVAVSNEPPRELRIEDIRAELSFHPGGTWQLSEADARIQGIRTAITATVFQAGDLRRRFESGGESELSGDRRRQLLSALELLEQIRISGDYSVLMGFAGGVRPGSGFQLTINLTAPQVTTQWGEAQYTSLSALVNRRQGTNHPVHAELRFRASPLLAGTNETTWADVMFEGDVDPETGVGSSKLDASFHSVVFRGVRSSPITVSAKAERDILGKTRVESMVGLTRLKADELQAADAKVSIRCDLARDWTLDGPRIVQAQFKDLQTRKIAASEASFDARISPHNAQQNPARGLWSKGAEWNADWSLTARQIVANNLSLAVLNASGNWSAPSFVLKSLQAEGFGGRLDASGSLDVNNRAAIARVEATFDYWQLAPMLTTNGRRFLAQYEFSAPPRVAIEAAVTLPAWTNTTPDWQGEVLPTLALAGRVEGGRGAYRTVTFDAVRTGLSFSNRIWHLPDLLLVRPEGRAQFSYTEDTRTRDYAFRGRAAIDPNAVRPLLEDDRQQRALDELRFITPPVVDGEVRGRWFERDRLGFDLNVALTNFAFRGEPASNATARVVYTNELFRVTDLRIASGPQVITAPLALLDVKAQRAWLTNVDSTFDPMPVARAIGRRTATNLAPYQFAKPPKVRVNGSVPLRDEDTSDLHFDIAGGPFAWQRFRVPDIRGTAHWVTNSLVLTNVTASFYGGEMQGDAAFDFSRGRGSDFRFALVVADADLHRLVMDVSTKTNKLEGTFSGVLSVTSGRTEDFKSWQGFGSTRLTNGLLWDVPLVGLFSPVLDAVVPGVGASRAREAKANFIITNSVIRTADLEIRSPPVRLHYDGTVDFDAKVNARVEAELFRDAFLIGPLLSFITTPLTKVFEYKVTGTLSQPEGEPTYVPKFLLLPLRPFHTLKQLIPGLDDPPKPERK